MSEHSEHHEHAGPGGHEGIEVSSMGLFISGLAILALVGVSMVVVWGLTGLFDAAESRSVADLPEDRLTPPGRTATELGTTIEPNQAVYRERQQVRLERILSTYGWVRPEEGIARVPIERAMEIVGQRGLEPWSEQAAEGDSSSGGGEP